MPGFEAVVAKQQRKVFSFAHYFLGRPEEAEDVTQEVFLKLWQHRDKVDFENAGAWLMRVTRNACYDRLRRKRSLSKVLVADAGAEAVELAVSNETEPDTGVMQSDFRRRLLAALHELGEPYKSILILREIQGLRYREISESLDLPLNTVRVYIHRGRQRLRESLKGAYGDVSVT